MAGSVGAAKVTSRPSPKRYSGMDPPLSLARPTVFDLQKTAELEKFLVDMGLYEGEEQSAKREEVLREINRIVKGWVKRLTSQKGFSEHIVEKANAVLFTFGSYRLGVHGPGADIDILCVGPSYVKREDDFFVTLHDILAQMEEVTELQPVPDAHVPVMKFKFHGMAIDLLYASVSLSVIPPIERDTKGMLQCHPYPCEYANPSVQCVHCSFYMGLSRKEGTKVHGQKFDIRATVDEFMHEIGMYPLWKSGMDLAVTHVHKKQIPHYVFEQGYKKPCLPLHANQQEQSDRNDTEDGTPTASLDGQLKRKCDFDGAGQVESGKSLKRSSVSSGCEENPPDSGNIVSQSVCENPVKPVSSVLCNGGQNSPLHGDVNLESANCSNSPHGSEVSAASGTSCAAMETVDMIDEIAGPASSVPCVMNGAVQAMAVHTPIKCVAEKEEPKFEGIDRLVSSNCAESLEEAETLTGNFLSENMHPSGK
ncbi:hypothetical protein ACQ4PT_022401 [Festuca glaucescens]